MERLRPSDYEAVLAFLRQLSAVEHLEALRRRAIAGLSRLIESDILTYNEIDPRRQRADYIDEPAGMIDHSQRATIPSTPELVIGIALNRSPHDSSERERSVLEAIG